jgi:hypothetical protein
MPNAFSVTTFIEGGGEGAGAEFAEGVKAAPWT